MSRASPPDVPHVLQYWLGSPRMMGLGAPIGPKFRDGAIWGAKPSPFGATRWTRGDVYTSWYMVLPFASIVTRSSGRPREMEDETQRLVTDHRRYVLMK